MKKIISLALVGVMVLCTIISTKSLVAQADENGEKVSILFTHDMHSHIQSQKVTENGKVIEKGGLAKIKTLKDQIEEKYPGTFLIDAGDFSMGTPFQTIYRTDAAELITMGHVGYDATTIGNHEFDYRAQGLADMLNVAAQYENNDVMLPQIVGTNINWKETLANEETKANGEVLKQAFDNYGVADYAVIEKNGVRMALFGLIGDEAISNAPEAGIVFDNYIERAKKVVKEIEKNEDVDIVVCLSHAGTDEADFDASEDVKLAKEVDGIDLIISGHSHTELPEAKTIGDTVLVSCGEYTNNLGQIILEKDGESYKIEKYSLISLDESIENDKKIENIVKDFKKKVNSKFFSEYGYSYDQVIAKNDYNFTETTKFAKEQGEDPLANLISDSYIYAVNQIEGQTEDPVDVVIIPAGVIRSSFNVGDITVADAFNISSLGYGPDGTVGYPIVSIYLTGKELKTAAEVDASISPGMTEARLYMSGMGYTINDKRLILNRATDFAIIDKDGNKVEKLDNDKLYRVVGGLYSCQMLSLVKEQSYGLLSIEPKDKDGNVITDFEQHIVKMNNGQELKEWYALASYIDSFDNNKVPEYYSTSHNRKVVDNSINPFKLLKQPNNIAIMVFAIIMIPIVIIVGIVVAIIRRKHRRRGYSRSMFSGSRNRDYKKTLSSRGVKPAVRHRKMNVRGSNRRNKFK